MNVTEIEKRKVNKKKVGKNKWRWESESEINTQKERCSKIDVKLAEEKESLKGGKGVNDIKEGKNET